MVFSNDLCLQVNDNVTVVQYADDVQILTCGKKQVMPQLITRMESALDKLYQWFCHHHMKVNEAKTQMMVMGTPAMLKNVPPVTIVFNGARIESSEVTRNLGLMMDRHLNFQDHVSSTVKRCTGTLMALNHARHAIPRNTLPCLVQALVVSILRYCMSVYGACSKTQTHRVQKIINFCARVVSGRRRSDHISDVLCELNWMGAEQLIQYHTMCAIHSALTTGQPEYICSTIGQPASQRHAHNTRRSRELTLPHIRTESGRRRLCYRGVNMINEISLDMSDPLFKKSLKQAILSRQLTSP